MKSLFRKILSGNIEIKEYSTITIKAEIKRLVFLEIEKLSLTFLKLIG